MDAVTSRLAQDLRDIPDGLLLVVTGAGVSQASGIQTFRGSEPDAVWNTSDVRLATREYFDSDPAGQWSWYLDRFSRLRSAEPNAAHEALVWLERWQELRGGRFLLVTQNIDTLHEIAGTRNLIKVHGTSDRVRCSQVGCANGAPRGSMPFEPEAFNALAREELDLEALPKCSECGAPVRAHVLFFDEYYTDHRDYRFDEVLAAAEKASVILFIGTSFSVGITDLLVRSAAKRRIPALSIDPSERTVPGVQVTQLSAKAEELLPAVCAALTRS